MVDSIVVIKNDSGTEQLYAELAELSSRLATEQVQYMGDIFKQKLNDYPTPLPDDYFKNDEVDTFCRIIDGKVVSFISTRHHVGLIGIEYIYTLPEYRRQGFILELFDHLFKLYNKKDNYFFLCAYVKNEQATKLYEKLGFKSNYVTMEL